MLSQAKHLFTMGFLTQASGALGQVFRSVDSPILFAKSSCKLQVNLLLLFLHLLQLVVKQSTVSLVLLAVAFISSRIAKQSFC